MKNTKPTIPQQYKLPSDPYREKAILKMEEFKLKQIQEQKEKQFKALDKPDFYPPTYAEAHDLSRTESEDFGMTGHIEARIKQRKLFEDYKQMKEHQMKLQQELQEEERLKREQEEIQRLRSETVYKAQPFDNKLELVQKVPPKPVTQAITPAFMKRLLSLKKKKE